MIPEEAKVFRVMLCGDSNVFMREDILAEGKIFGDKLQDRMTCENLFISLLPTLPAR